jgi:hypothetical protein
MFAEGSSPRLTVYRVITARDFHGDAYQDTFLALGGGPYIAFPKTG